MASLAGTAVDFAAFYLLSALLFRGESLLEIGCATVLARVASAAANFLLNRRFVFRSRAAGARLCAMPFYPFAPSPFPPRRYTAACTCSIGWAAAVFSRRPSKRRSRPWSIRCCSLPTTICAKSGCFKRPARKRSRDRGARRPAAGLSAQAPAESGRRHAHGAFEHGGKVRGRSKAASGGDFLNALPCGGEQRARAQNALLFHVFAKGAAQQAFENLATGNSC